MNINQANVFNNPCLYFLTFGKDINHKTRKVRTTLDKCTFDGVRFVFKARNGRVVTRLVTDLLRVYSVLHDQLLDGTSAQRLFLI